jgi:hypothetical protein
MRRHRLSTNPSRRQEGYALLLVVFFMALLVVGTMSIGLRVLTEGRREKEKELIWRGKQYTRAIKLYYRKTGRFPTTVDNLVLPSTGNIRFLRQAYKEPMNKDDGSWRFIYVGPSGQLIGSLNPQNNLLALGTPGLGAQPGQTATSSSGFGFGATGGSTNGVGLPGSTAGNQSTNGFSLFGSGTQTSPTSTTNPSGTSTTSGATATDTTNSTGTNPLQAALDSDPPTIVGGNIIGVGSKINHSSIMVFEKAKNYKLFEFIWNPANDVATISTGGSQIGTPAGSQGTPGQPGQNGSWQNGGFGFAPPGQGGAGQGGTGAPGNGNPNPPQLPPTSNPNPQQP